MDLDLARQRLSDERERLTQVKDELKSASENERESTSELSSMDQHQADIATELFDRERDLGILEAVEGELAEVERALGRIDDGSYGTCEACGQPIGDARLEAQPYARLCVEDQQRAERESRATDASA
ncbi:MAG: TraR/DksA C4-type zinc finger protein [Acidimicrobiia bacterium]